MAATEPSERPSRRAKTSPFHIAALVSDSVEDWKTLKGEGSYRSWAVEFRCDDSCSVVSLPSPVIAQSTKDKELNTQGEGHLQRMASWMPWPQQVIRRQCSPVLKRSIHCDRPLRVQSLVHVWQRCWTAAQPSQSSLYSQLLGLSFCIRIGCCLAHFAGTWK